MSFTVKVYLMANHAVNDVGFSDVFSLFRVSAKNIVWKNLVVSHLFRETLKIQGYFAVCLIIIPYGTIFGWKPA